MKRLIWAMSFVVACSVTASGQAPSADKPAPDKKMMKHGPVSVTGCVAETTDGEFTLTNAMMAKPSSDKMAADSAAMNHPALTYRLSGGTDLKAHVGHKVEVSGTMGKMNHMDKGEKGDMAKDRPAATADKAMKPATLNITTMTMISATCP